MAGLRRELAGFTAWQRFFREEYCHNAHFGQVSRMTRFSIILCALLMAQIVHTPVARASDAQTAQSVSQPAEIPKARWDHRPGSTAWTLSALNALSNHGVPLVQSVPRDIAAWCPGYPTANAEQRAAFWVGFLSTLSKYESTYRATAVGGGGRWFGLLQILPGTARGYGCRARSGGELKDGGSNLSCAIRIMARTVTRDGAIALHEGRWRGVAADWGPMRDAGKRAEMSSWLRGQSYCAITTSPRPQPRPRIFNTTRSARNTR